MAEREKPWHARPEFLAERKKWYDKLKRSGFKDVEIHNWRDGSTWERMNGFSQMDGIKADVGRERGRLNGDYFYRAKQYQRCVARRHGAQSLEYQVWRRHADGLGKAQIAEQLQVGQWRVQSVTDRLREGMQRWLRAEMRRQDRDRYEESWEPDGGGEDQE